MAAPSLERGGGHCSQDPWLRGSLPCSQVIGTQKTQWSLSQSSGRHSTSLCLQILKKYIFLKSSMNTGMFQLNSLVFLKSSSKAMRVSRLLVHNFAHQDATPVASFHTAVDCRELPRAHLLPTWLWHQKDKALATQWPMVPPLLGKSLLWLTPFISCLKGNHSIPRARFPWGPQRSTRKIRHKI